jgi:UDP-N-acetylmuramoyl-tripeptide--D-alanyl-D-alanine ligase
MKLGEIQKLIEPDATPHRALAEAGEREPVGYSIDSRTIREGELYFAIRGERYDGHRFVRDAIDKGAIAAVVARDFSDADAVPDDAAEGKAPRLIRAADTLVALQSLASEALREWRGREVAVTGSMGKTTTKEMTAATLARIGRVMKTTGNLNNDYGLPLSILKMESDGAHVSDFDFAVLEMGMNHKGEISRLTQIAPPDLGVVTIVAPVHLEFFESVDAIAEAKAEMVRGIKPGGAAVLNADDERVIRMREMRSDIDYITFGVEREADVTAREIRSEGFSGSRFTLVTPRGEVAAHLPVAGRHNIYNALVAAAAADFYGASLEEIARALSGYSSPRMRGEVLRFDEGFTIIDDSYNSNPRALVEMVRTLCSTGECSRRIVVAGEMLELGAEGPALHRDAGRRIAELGVDRLIGVRGLAEQIVAGAREAGMNHEAASFSDTPDEAAEILAREARAGDLILVKGSRGVKTEIVIERMKGKTRL